MKKVRQFIVSQNPLILVKIIILFASHLGLVGEGMDNLNFSNQISVYDDFYFMNFYGYNNKTTFYFSMNAPYNCPKEFFQIYKDTSMKYYNFIVENVTEK